MTMSDVRVNDAKPCYKDTYIGHEPQRGPRLMQANEGYKRNKRAGHARQK